MEGRQRYFRASRGSPVFAEIEALVRKTFGQSDVLRRALAPLATRIVFAGVYGSTARGTAHARSDVDLLVVGEVEYLALAGALLEAETTLRRAVNPTLFTLEWRRRVRERGGFVRDLLSKPMLPLIGAIDVLAKPGEDRKPARAAQSAGRDAPKAQLGESEITGGTTDWDKRQVSKEEFQEMATWAEAGWVTIAASDGDDGAQDPGWIDSAAQKHPDDLKRVLVVPTQKGLQMQAASTLPTDGDSRLLYISFRTNKVESIAENREICSSVDRIRVVKVQGRTELTEAGKFVYSRIKGDPLLPRWKAIYVFAFDAFDRSWKFQAADSADVDKEFTTFEVRGYLRRIGCAE